jgi:hypothetical protein
LKCSIISLFSWEAVYACTHTHAHEFSRCASVVLDAIHGAIAVRADEEPSDDPGPVRPCSPSRLHGRLLAMSLPVEAATPHPLIPPPRREGHPPLHLYARHAHPVAMVSEGDRKLPYRYAWNPCMR